jgi:hypothetical protein
LNACAWIERDLSLNVVNHNGSKAILGLMTLVALCLACNVPVDEYVGRYRMVTQKPEKADLIGVWVIDQATFEDMKARDAYHPSRPTEIVLRGDDSFELTNMPDWYKDGFGESHGQVVNLTGKWRVTGNNGFWTVELEAVVGALEPQLVLREPRYGSQPRYLIEMDRGDLDDSSDTIRFFKK